MSSILSSGKGWQTSAKDRASENGRSTKQNPSLCPLPPCFLLSPHAHPNQKIVRAGRISHTPSICPWVSPPSLSPTTYSFLKRMRAAEKEIPKHRALFLLASDISPLHLYLRLSWGHLWRPQHHGREGWDRLSLALAVEVE